MRGPVDGCPAVHKCRRSVRSAHFAGRAARENVDVSGRLIRNGHDITTARLHETRDHDASLERGSSITGPDANRHVARTIGAYVSFGTPLVSIETHIAFRKLLDRLPALPRSCRLAWTTGDHRRCRTMPPVSGS
jgi:hypothetical protein